MTQWGGKVNNFGTLLRKYVEKLRIWLKSDNNIYHFTRTLVFYIVVSDMFSATIQKTLGRASVATFSWQPLYVCQ